MKTFIQNLIDDLDDLDVSTIVTLAVIGLACLTIVGASIILALEFLKHQ